MRHRVARRKFGLPSDQRRAMLRGVVRSLFQHDKIVTTEARAKDARIIAEQLITTAKQNTIHARREVRRFLDSNVAEFGINPDTGKIARNPATGDGQQHYVVPRLFEVIAPRYKSRSGGYTRITKLAARRGDGAPLVMLELVDSDALPLAPAAAETTQTRPKRGLLGRKK